MIEEGKIVETIMIDENLVGEKSLVLVPFLIVTGQGRNAQVVVYDEEINLMEPIDNVMVELCNDVEQVKGNDCEFNLQEGYESTPNIIAREHPYKGKISTSDSDSLVQKKKRKNVIVTRKSSQVPSKPVRLLS